MSPGPLAILGVGGAHVDRIGHLSGPAHGGASNPGTMAEWVGGCMANTLRVARAVGGARIGLISARGGDTGGRLVAEALSEAGIADFSAVFLDRATPSYTAIMDADGEVMAALADMDLYETGLARYLRRAEPRALIADAGMLLVDANLPSDAIGALCDAANAPVIALAVSPAKAPRILPHAGRFALTFVNRREMNALIGAPLSEPVAPGALARLSALGLGRVIISNGGDPVTVLDGDAAWRQPLGEPATPVDVTGAGDALAGATLAQRPDMPLADAVRFGIAAAAATIGVTGPVRPDIAACDLKGAADALPAAEPIALNTANPSETS
ncbi:MAG: carbohydrate kinase [Roseitalea sp.]|nr:carbohydrate kinase [Roseitalea sp.]MBO6723814.1 carbohydrate kinase [Roseitalea sp.]MBO6744707.1 carbohydrate kinase [Roseitalea sp.]